MRSCTQSYVKIQDALYSYLVMKCCKWSGFGVDKRYSIVFSSSDAGADGCGQNISYILLRRYPYNRWLWDCPVCKVLVCIVRGTGSGKIKSTKYVVQY
jgi:hypothetical protein